MFFRGGKNEDCVRRRLFQGFKEGVECRLAEHVYLIHDEHAVLANLRGNVHLVYEHLDVVYAVVGGGVKLMDAVRTALLEGDAGFALAARLHVRARMGAVDSLCKDTCRTGFAHSARAAEQVSVCQLTAQNGVFERLGNVVLTYQGFEGIRTVFSCRYYILRHRRDFCYIVYKFSKPD